MKKIFAIALALVMVLSMTSAFASWCRTDFDWNCATTVCENGTGSVELIPYVKGNGCGTGNTYTVSKCAGAVNGDKIYFAIKLTVEADPSVEWWKSAKLEFSTVKGVNKKIMQNNQDGSALVTADEGLYRLLTATNTDNELKAGEYYLTTTKDNHWMLVKAADFDADATTLFTTTVTEAAKAKVCVKLSSKNSFGESQIGDWKVKFEKDANLGNLLTFTKKNSGTVGVRLDKNTDKVVRISGKLAEDTSTGAGIVFVSVRDGMLVDGNGKTYGTGCNEAALVAEVMNLFKFSFGTCMTEKAIKANFGWNNSSESCFQWSKDALAVVNAECQVAIPKTGDVSVVAYAVMALVAAAGAMGLKK